MKHRLILVALSVATAGCVSLDAPTACGLDAAACEDVGGSDSTATGDSTTDGGDSGGVDSTGDSGSETSDAPTEAGGDADGAVDADAGDASCKPSATRCDGKRLYKCAGDGVTETFEDCAIGCSPDGCLVPTKVAAGGYFSCAVMNSGALYCWGNNNYGQLGDGTKIQREKPTLVMSDAVDVTAGFAVTCAVRKDNTVACWGVAVGAATPAEKLVPTTVPGISASTVTCGTTHCCALLKDGSVACWGDNSDGGLGDGTDINRATPGILGGLTGVTALRCGASSCFAKAGSTWKAWGDAYYGQLGEGSSGKVQRDPVEVPALAGYSEACVSGNFGCGRNGTAVSCWGLQNDSGQLGSGDKSISATPRSVLGGTGVSALSCGGYTACATAVGGALCWGANSAGQIGDGSSAARLSAFAVPGTSPISTVATGLSHTCAGVGQSVLCWGSNSKGELGIGTTTGSSTPKSVIW